MTKFVLNLSFYIRIRIPDMDPDQDGQKSIRIQSTAFTRRKISDLKSVLSSELKSRSSCLLTTRKWSDLWSTRNRSRKLAAVLWSTPFHRSWMIRANFLHSTTHTPLFYSAKYGKDRKSFCWRFFV